MNRMRGQVFFAPSTGPVHRDEKTQYAALPSNKNPITHQNVFLSNYTTLPLYLLKIIGSSEVYSWSVRLHCSCHRGMHKEMYLTCTTAQAFSHLSEHDKICIFNTILTSTLNSWPSFPPLEMSKRSPVRLAPCVFCRFTAVLGFVVW